MFYFTCPDNCQLSIILILLFNPSHKFIDDPWTFFKFCWFFRKYFKLIWSQRRLVQPSTLSVTLSMHIKLRWRPIQSEADLLHFPLPLDFQHELWWLSSNVIGDTLPRSDNFMHKRTKFIDLNYVWMSEDFPSRKSSNKENNDFFRETRILSKTLDYISVSFLHQ